MHRRRSIVALAAPLAFAAALVAVSPPSAHAECDVALDGTYVHDVRVNDHGELGCPSIADTLVYTPTPSAFSCPLLPSTGRSEGYRIVAQIPTATRTIRSTDLIATPSLSGSELRWVADYAVDPFYLHIEERWRLRPGDRYVTLETTISNTGSTAWTNMVYGRGLDPSPSACEVGASTATTNDLLRNPPVDTYGLAVASGGTLVPVTLGVASGDLRARASMGSRNFDPPSVWAVQNDPGGTVTDDALQIAFRERPIGPGESATFLSYYVFGRTPEEVRTTAETTLVTTSCVEGAACTDGAGRSGTCHASACCTGCWNGTACVAGTTLEACGTAGAACASCSDADTDACTTASCETGTCRQAPSSGAACDDGLFCTVSDTCSSGTCRGVTRDCQDGLACTTDTCDEAANRCVGTPSSGCAIRGMCVAEHAVNPADPCLHCDPTTSRTEWSAFPASAAPAGCGPRCTPSSCDATQFCDEVSGRCTAKGAGGTTCSTNLMCQSGDCARGICCATSGGCEASDAGASAAADAGGPLHARDAGTDELGDDGGTPTPMMPATHRRSGCAVAAPGASPGMPARLLAALSLVCVALWLSRRRASTR